LVTEDPQIFGTTAQNVVTQPSWHSEFIHARAEFFQFTYSLWKLWAYFLHKSKIFARGAKLNSDCAAFFKQNLQPIYGSPEPTNNFVAHYS